MSGFIYFVSGGAPNDQDAQNKAPLTLKEAGIEVVDGATVRGTKSGPNGSPGFFVNGPGCIKMPKFIEGEQYWEQIPANPNLWIGYGEKPTPEVLARPKQLNGKFVEIDGHKWLVPMVKSWGWEESLVWYSELPMVAKLDANGEWTRQSVVQKHKKLFEYAELFMDKWNERHLRWLAENEDRDTSGIVEIEFDFPEQNAGCVEALSTNYYVGNMELHMLDVLTDTSRNDIFEAMVDFDGYRAILQKKTQELQGTTGG